MFIVFVIYFKLLNLFLKLIKIISNYEIYVHTYITTCANISDDKVLENIFIRRFSCYAF